MHAFWFFSPVRPAFSSLCQRFFKNRFNTQAFGLIALLSLGAFTVSAHAQSSQAPLPTLTLYAGMHKIVSELAATPEQRAIGLMGRQSMPENQGMLFVFEQPRKQCFWMKQTLIPLSIAFIKDDGTITNIAHMSPLSLDSHCSTEPVRLALEVNQGWFEKRHLQAGTRILGIPPLP